MGRKMLKSKVWLAILIGLSLTFSASNVFARGVQIYQPQHRDRGDRREVVEVNHHRYNYHDGKFYRPSFFGLEFFISKPLIGATVTFLPAGHRVMNYSGVTYYYYNDIYYRPCSAGYVVVPAPAVNVVSAPVVIHEQSSNRELVTINVPNSDGSFTGVTLLKKDNGYYGPQGEYYSGNPSVEQLRALYGK